MNPDRLLLDLGLALLFFYQIVHHNGKFNHLKRIAILIEYGIPQYFVVIILF